MVWSVCPACHTEMRECAGVPWARRCPLCGIWSSSLKPTIGSSVQPACSIDESAVVRGLEALRRDTYERILDRLQLLMPSAGKRLLDVGCSYGWFLEAAARRGFQVMGIEPDSAIAQVALQRGYRVDVGLFPSVISGEARSLDAIAFNDTLEHIPDVEQVLLACQVLLRQGGLLVVNCPSAKGMLYRLAVIAARFGAHAPVERLWQKGFVSPHVYYFTGEALQCIAERCGFTLVYEEALPMIRLPGLWSRLRVDSSTPLYHSMLVWAALVPALPIVNRKHKDILLHVYQSA